MSSGTKAFVTWNHVAKANRAEGDEGVVEGVQEAPTAFIKLDAQITIFKVGEDGCWDWQEDGKEHEEESDGLDHSLLEVAVLRNYLLEA